MQSFLCWMCRRVVWIVRHLLFHKRAKWSISSIQCMFAVGQISRHWQLHGRKYPTIPEINAKDFYFYIQKYLRQQIATHFFGKEGLTLLLQIFEIFSLITLSVMESFCATSAWICVLMPSSRAPTTGNKCFWISLTNICASWLLNWLHITGAKFTTKLSRISRIWLSLWLECNTNKSVEAPNKVLPK